MEPRQWWETVVFGGFCILVVVGVAWVVRYKQEQVKRDTCVEESLSTLEAWRLSEKNLPAYGLPSRYVVSARGALWACGMPTDRVRCYRLTDCKE